MSRRHTHDISLPFSDLLRNFFAEKPKEVDGVANASTIYYKEWLLKMIFARFGIGGFPSFWEMDYYLEHQFLDGKICITDTGLGVIPLKCGVTGIGVFDQPTTCQIANPVLGSFTKTIDVDCVLVKLQYNYHGIGWLINRYATMLAMCDSGVAVNLMNSKMAYVFKASSKAQAATMQKMYDDITCGKPAVFVGENGALNSENVFTMPVKQNFVADEIQILKRKIVNEFLSEIGINNANLDKRERLNSEEVNANNEEVYCNIQHWFDNISEGFRKANAMFGLNLSIKIRDFGREGDINVGSSELT